MPHPICVKNPRGRTDPSRVPTALALAMSTALAALPGAAWAQSASPHEVPATQSKRQDAAPAELKTVNVTARHSQERTLDVPFGLSVIDGEEVEARRLQSAEEVLRSEPGVAIDLSDVNSANVIIRGVGSLYRVSRDDSSVALNVNGVSMSMHSVNMGTLDVERIEVLKGSQGTLFGGNSHAGAINITTKRPTRALEGHGRAEFGQGHEHLQEAVISGPLSTILSGRLALRNTGADHWIVNAQSGDPVSKPRTQAWRGSLLWDIAPETSALIISERDHNERRPSQIVLRPYGSPPRMDLPTGIFDGNHKTTDRHSLELNHRLQNSRLTSITAYTTVNFEGTKSYDRLLTKALYGRAMERISTDSSDEKKVSQELRLSSLPGAPVFWVTGLHLSSTDRSLDSVSRSSNQKQLRDFKTDSHAVYGEVTYPLTGTLKVTGGLRQSMDKKRYDATYTGAVRDNRSLNDSYTTGRLALSYALAPSTNVYSAYSRGYQSGGFNDFTSTPADSIPYQPARSNALEVGFKTESADRRLALNGALFMTRVKDAHLLGFDFTNFSVSTINVDTESRGAELKGTWHLGRGFELTGGLSYTRADIKSDATGVYGGNVQTGNRVPDVPRWSSSLSLAYRQPVPQFLGLTSPVLNARLSYLYVGARPNDPQNHFDLGAYHKVDMRVGVASRNAEVYVYGSDLLNEKYDLYGYHFRPGVSVGAPSRGRTLGVGATWYF